MRLRGSWRLILVITSMSVALGCAGGGQSSGAPSGPASPSATTPSDARSVPPTLRPTPVDRPVNGPARAVGFVDVRSVVPDAVIDLRYATTDNFVGVRLYPATARCLVHESMKPGLRAAAAKLRATGDVLVFWDCYRPHSVQQKMFEKVPNPAWVARPGPYSRSHEAGRSVDVTIASKRTNCPAQRRVADRCLADMGTDFDSFTPQATAYATEGVSPAARASRARLRDAMATGGLQIYSGEWWHFDGPGAGVQRPIIDVPLT